MSRGTVYILRAKGKIKIGYSSFFPRRWVELRQGGLVRIVGKLAGTLQNERSIHRCLAGHQHEGSPRSWYKPSKHVLAVVAEVLAPSFNWKTSRILLVADAQYNKRDTLRRESKDMRAKPTTPTPVSNICRANLMLIARAYARTRGVSLGQISKEIYGNINFLKDFERQSQSVSLVKYDEMIHYMKSKWPEDAPWPMCQVIPFKGPEKR